MTSRQNTLDELAKIYTENRSSASNKTFWRTMNAKGVKGSQLKPLGDHVFLFNYRQWAGGKQERFTRHCRNLVVRFNPVVSEDVTVFRPELLSVTFARFFNFTENLENQKHIVQTIASHPGRVRAIEKMDGSIIAKSYIDGKWVSFTRGALAHANPIEEFKVTFGDASDQLLAEQKIALDPSIIYAFELCMPGRLVTRYERSRLVLIGAFDRESGKDIDIYELSKSASTSKFDLPEFFLPDSIEHVYRVLASKSPDFEGYVLCDTEILPESDSQNFVRAKVKSPSYIELHNKLSKVYTTDMLASIVLKGEEHEILIASPELKDKIASLKSGLEKTHELLKSRIGEWCEFPEVELGKYMEGKKHAGMAKWVFGRLRNPGTVVMTQENCLAIAVSEWGSGLKSSMLNMTVW